MQLKQRSPEWYEALKTTIGGSDIATIMGKNPFKEPIELYEELVGIKPRSTFESDAMKRGSELEDQARDWYNKATGRCLYQPDCHIHPDFPDMRCSLDGIDFAGERAIEIKSPNCNKLSYIKDYGVQDEYYIQIQYAYWFFPNLKQIDLVVYQGEHEKMGRTHAIFPVKKDSIFIADMIYQVMNFKNGIHRKLPPNDTRKKIEHETDETEYWATKATQLKDARDSVSVYKKIQDELEEEIKAYAKGRNLKGKGLQITHSTQKGFIDYSLIPELKGIDLEQYRKADTKRTIIRVDS